jgi:hypothetical protein
MKAGQRHIDAAGADAIDANAVLREQKEKKRDSSRGSHARE